MCVFMLAFGRTLVAVLSLKACFGKALTSVVAWRVKHALAYPLNPLKDLQPQILLFSLILQKLTTSFLRKMKSI